MRCAESDLCRNRNAYPISERLSERKPDMKYFEFGMENAEIMILLHGCRILCEVLADPRLTITTTIADGKANIIAFTFLAP